MTGARLLAPFATAAVLALVSGCGGSSSHSSSAGGSHAAGSSHSAGSSHYRTYTGPGFTLSIPAGWRQEGAASAAGGAMGMALAPPDHSASLTIHVYPNSNQGVDQTIATT
ncbi:MAG: hypothetical protein JO046_22455, partial [Solirubrobacterales bacterium]|nr:hypothetical protein [Solirubrobacterales bacterium]